MKIILVGDKEVKKVLGTQHKSKSVYRLCDYCVAVQIEEGFLIFNQITKELVLHQSTDFESFINSPKAIRDWFSVPEKFDEQSLVINLKNELRKNSAIPNEITLFHIFTTTLCNAKCYYCFEKGNQKCGTMNIDTAKVVADYIMKHKSKNKKTMLAWFGGEPLLNCEVIDVISSDLNKKNFDFDAVITTNAYLIDKEMIDRAKKNWNIIAWNITLDGTEEIYNKTKNFNNTNKNAYQIVIHNIGLLLDEGFKVTIRLNLSCYNYDDLLNLIDELYDRFGSKRNLTVYCATLYERKLEEFFKRTEQEEIIVRRKEKDIFDKVVKLKLFEPRLLQKLKVYRCNPDSGYAVSILPDGKIGWCEDYVDREIISDIYSKNFDIKKINAFKERFDDLPECKKCPIYPDCNRLKKCDIDTPWCTQYKRKVSLYKLKTSMKYEFRLFKNND